MSPSISKKKATLSIGGRYPKLRLAKNQSGGETSVPSETNAQRGDTEKSQPPARFVDERSEFLVVGPDSLPNLTYGNISPDDYLSKITERFENFEGVSGMLLPGEIWRYYHGGTDKELKKRHTFKRNGMLPTEESGRYVDVIARPGLPRGSN
ncbi:hypothetical protein TWF225_006552 [Orbilia oligospora]|nr:hypothetical protein TWF225_006552 [Orbilia oligospora]KAF3265067.1 hypothetical protein TWF217_002716 [Orbilia oligospora]KAF3268062.1 hypothetical protein TWF128_008076 [Orbilia oligospora]KAF3290087.1 hypothetical protein TWF132_007284 [Orbilia oligospora]